MTSIEMAPIKSDPDVGIGGYLTLERADGRSVWRQRFVVEHKTSGKYFLRPVDEFGGYT